MKLNNRYDSHGDFEEKEGVRTLISFVIQSVTINKSSPFNELSNIFTHKNKP